MIVLGSENLVFIKFYLYWGIIYTETAQYHLENHIYDYILGNTAVQIDVDL